MNAACGSAVGRGSVAKPVRQAFGRVGILVAAFAVILCAGCVQTRTGATLDELTQKIGTPMAGQARIVVIRDKEYGGMFDAGWQVQLDGAAMGELKTGTFVYRDSPSGTHRLSFERPGDMARASTHDFTAMPGRTYVFRLEVNDKGRMVYASSISAGLAGMMLSSAISNAADARGFFDFTLLEGDAARAALAELRLAG